MSVQQHAALCEHWARYWTYSDATYQLYDFCFTLCLVGLLLFLWKDKLFDWSNGIIIFFASPIITFLGLVESSFLIVVWDYACIVFYHIAERERSLWITGLSSSKSTALNRSLESKSSIQWIGHRSLLLQYTRRKNCPGRSTQPKKSPNSLASPYHQSEFWYVQILLMI